MSPVSLPVVAEVVRSGFVEGHHHGSVVALDAGGSVDWSVGDVASAVLPRSCNKPLQALGMVRLGLDLEPELLALACASHSGEDFHVAGVRRILAHGGLDESALQTPPDYPLDDAARDAVIRAGGEKLPVLMNCSGKHAAMLLTCVVNGWDTATYREPEHPLQRAIAESFSALTGEPVEVVAVDGCGAPLLSASLTGLARGFRALAVADDGPERRVADAIRDHPAYVSGSTRDERALLTAIPGAIGKAGAEACYAVALRGRPGLRAQGRRRLPARAAGPDGRGAAPQRRGHRARGRHRRGARDGPRGAPRRRRPGGRDPRDVLVC